jgi:hypothetical protein
MEGLNKRSDVMKRKRRGFSQSRLVETLKKKIAKQDAEIDRLRTALERYDETGDGNWYESYEYLHRWQGDDEMQKIWVFPLDDGETYPWEVAQKALGTEEKT